MLTKTIIQCWNDEHRGLKMWLFGNSEEIIDTYSILLIEATISVYDWIPKAPLMVFPIPLPQKTGQVFRDHYFINPVHCGTEMPPDVWVVTDGVIVNYAGGHEEFFKDPQSQTQKIMNGELLQELHNHKFLHLVGVVPPIDHGIKLV